MALTRTNVTLAPDLLRRVDAVAGPRGRSRYVAEAIEDRVRRDELGQALDETFGATLGRPDHRGSDEVARWVRNLRSEDDTG